VDPENLKREGLGEKALSLEQVSDRGIDSDPRPATLSRPFERMMN